MCWISVNVIFYSRWKEKINIFPCTHSLGPFALHSIDKRPAEIHSAWNEVQDKHNNITMCRKKTYVNVFMSGKLKPLLSRRFVSDIYVTKDVRVNETGSPSVHL